MDRIEFSRLEHAGWERVAGKYEQAWASLTTQFVGPLLEATGITPGMRVLDVACGPGYVAAAALSLGASPIGIDFSGEMIHNARKLNPEIQFFESDAQKLS